MRTMKLVKLWKKYRRLMAFILGTAAVLAGTVLVLRYARGYRPRMGKNGPTISGTGLLVADSDPRGASVFLNGKLTTATDDTLNLAPGEYEVEIKKDGYIPWRKHLKITAELVAQTSARLFPSVPNMIPMTFTGAKTPAPSPDGQKIVYQVDSASVTAKNGLWVLEMSNRNLPVARASEPKQIARNTSEHNFMDANLTWTPDSSQVLAYWEEPEKDQVISQALLLDASRFNDAPEMRDATSGLPVLLAQWYSELDLAEQKRILKLPELMQGIVAQSPGAAYFSPDEIRVLYSPAEELTISDHLRDDLPSESTQPEERNLKPNQLYVYDIKEDRNYLIENRDGFGKVSLNLNKEKSSRENSPAGEESLSLLSGRDYWLRRQELSDAQAAMETKADKQLPPAPDDLLIVFLSRLAARYSPIYTQNVQWFPTSAHLLEISDKNITLVEYDGNNRSVVYDGPFFDRFSYPWPNGSRLVILATLNDLASSYNLYAVSLE